MEPKKEGDNLQRERRAEREVASCLTWKERGCTPSRKRGPIDLQLHPPPFPRWSSGVWSWLASWSLLGSRVVERLWPLPTSRRAPHDLGTADAPPWASVMQSILVRRQTTDVCFLLAPSYPATLDLATAWSRRRREACNVKQEVKDTLARTQTDVNMLRSTRANSKTQTCL